MAAFSDVNGLPRRQAGVDRDAPMATPSTSENAVRPGRSGLGFDPPFPDMRRLRLSYGMLKSWWPDGELVMMGA